MEIKANKLKTDLKTNNQETNGRKKIYVRKEDFTDFCVLMQGRKKTVVFSVGVKKRARLASSKNTITRFVKNFTKTFVM